MFRFICWIAPTVYWDLILVFICLQISPEENLFHLPLFPESGTFFTGKPHSLFLAKSISNKTPLIFIIWKKFIFLNELSCFYFFKVMNSVPLDGTLEEHFSCVYAWGQEFESQTLAWWSPAPQMWEPVSALKQWISQARVQALELQPPPPPPRKGRELATTRQNRHDSYTANGLCHWGVPPFYQVYWFFCHDYCLASTRYHKSNHKALYSVCEGAQTSPAFLTLPCKHLQ